MKADSTKLAGILTPASRYVIPLFQRDYVWATKDWENLWDDIVELHESQRTGRSHFMGAIVLVPEAMEPNKLPTFQVIDGQQRLITLSLVLCALRDVALNLGHHDLSKEITASYLVHQFKKDEEHYRVYPRWRDRDQYVAAVERKSVPGETIRKALDFFTQQIEALLQSASENELRAFYEMFCNRLEFVQINLGVDENPFQIFRSLNSTGVDLAESDLIRNFMFMQMSEKDQADFDKNYWEPLEHHFESRDSKEKGKLDGKGFSAFLRDFLMHNGNYVGINDTFEKFEVYRRHKTDAIEVVKELDDNVQLYDAIRGLKPHTSNDANLENALKQLRQLESSTAYPIVLNLLNRVKLGSLSIHDATHGIRLLSGFILRRYICNESSRTYGKWLVQGCSFLKNNPLEDLRSYLHSRGYPDDAQFQEAFVNFKMYKGNRVMALVILKSLEMSSLHKERADLSTAQIEHIMPQSLTPEWINSLGLQHGVVHERWLHTPGNLTITAYNRELAQKSFIAKRKIYSDSNFQLTKAIAQLNPPIWNEAQIVKRGRLMAERANNIWIGPDA